MKNMLRKIQMLGLALFAVFVSSAVLAGMASAETTLLAEWLRNGVAIAANLASETSVEISFEVTNVFGGPVAFLCSFILDGTVGPNGADEITKALNLTKEEKALVCGNVAKCESGTAVEGQIENLPWKTTLFLMENGEILDLVEKFALAVLCLIIGLETEILCEAADTEFKVINEAGVAEVPAGETMSPTPSCTDGAFLSLGLNTTDALSPITLVEGGTLSVSSE
jgi:hypothetical protein